MTEIQGCFQITVDISLNLSMKNYLGGWFWNFNFTFTWHILALFISIRASDLVMGTKLGREQVYDMTGHTRPAFHFWGTAHELYS